MVEEPDHFLTDSLVPVSQIRANSLVLDGTVSANGNNASDVGSAGGAGGSVHLSITSQFSGTGVIRANGGAGFWGQVGVG
jgi:hypothetical protein